MAQTAVTNIRIDSDVKKRATGIFCELGMPLSTAVNIFLRAVIRENGMPFDVKLEDKIEAEIDD